MCVTTLYYANSFLLLLVRHLFLLAWHLLLLLRWKNDQGKYGYKKEALETPSVEEDSERRQKRLERFAAKDETLSSLGSTLNEALSCHQQL